MPKALPSLVLPVGDQIPMLTSPPGGPVRRVESPREVPVPIQEPEKIVEMKKTLEKKLAPSKPLLNQAPGEVEHPKEVSVRVYRSENIPQVKEPTKKRVVPVKRTVTLAPAEVAQPKLGPNQCLAEIQSKPQGASLLLNGISMGTTPTSVIVRCATRTELSLEFAGYQTIRQNIRVTRPKSELIINMTAFPEESSRNPSSPNSKEIDPLRR